MGGLGGASQARSRCTAVTQCLGPCTQQYKVKNPARSPRIGVTQGQPYQVPGW